MTDGSSFVRLSASAAFVLRCGRGSFQIEMVHSRPDVGHSCRPERSKPTCQLWAISGTAEARRTSCKDVSGLGRTAGPLLNADAFFPELGLLWVDEPGLFE